jgi:ABC-type dipeptide/oligopeptide/nickel transport system permease subunit
VRSGRLLDGWVRASALWLGLMLLAGMSAHWVPEPAAGQQASPNTLEVVFGSIHGARTSLLVVLGVVGISVPLGTLLGGMAGSGHRPGDFILSRSVELCGTWPSVILVSLLRGTGAAQGMLGFVLLLGMVRAVHLGRLVRSETLRLWASDFALGARALGLGRTRLFLRHLLPHLESLILSHAALASAWAVTLEAGLSLAGLGTPPDWSSWGNSMARAAGPGVGLALPALAAAGTALSFGVLADAVATWRTPQGYALTAPTKPLQTTGVEAKGGAPFAA